tara:strand:- start:3406 stop:4131 length:726 start_codon:yes stop_codon:yes gene_type:complete
MNSFQPGDHLVTNLDTLGLTKHHGLYIGNHRIIHLAKSGTIEDIDIGSFSNGNSIWVKRSTYFPDLAIEYALSKLGCTSYNLVTNNCEQFVNECLDEQRTSNQVSNVSHLAIQTAARSGLLGRAASKVATGSIANVALASTAAKMTGEYLGLPDNVNTVLGTPGDLVGKPLECLFTGTTRTLEDSYDCLAKGELSNAGIKLVTGAIETGTTALIFTPVVVTVTGAKAGVELVSDAWHWLWD